MSDKNSRWPICRQVEQRERRTERMIERLGVEPAALVRLRQGDVYADVRQACFECRNSDRCRLWLEMVDPQTSEPDFCPNLKTFVDCRRLDQLFIRKGK